MVDEEELDPFDSLFNLEETYYAEGYNQGYKDGVAQSRMEARLFGIQKGYEKFVTVGKLYAKARVWAARADVSLVPQDGVDAKLEDPFSLKENTSIRAEVAEASLRSLSKHPRLRKHIQTLLVLVDPRTLSYENTDEAVSDTDDRIKRAEAKVKIIERMIGEETAKTQTKTTSQANEANMEDFGLKNTG